jgi:hypothetical protein
MIDLDNGPEFSSSRRPFMKRLIEFAISQEIAIELVYYPQRKLELIVDASFPTDILLAA